MFRNVVFPSVTAFILTLSPAIATVLLLIASNVFRTFAWYGNLKFEDKPLRLTIIS
tara:strand:+ start:47626 stop:47793 length:168 start_codon:yes stop_codon:yes gene_type:complete